MSTATELLLRAEFTNEQDQAKRTALLSHMKAEQALRDAYWAPDKTGPGGRQAILDLIDRVNPPNASALVTKWDQATVMASAVDNTDPAKIRESGAHLYSLWIETHDAVLNERERIRGRQSLADIAFKLLYVLGALMVITGEYRRGFQVGVHRSVQSDTRRK